MRKAFALALLATAVACSDPAPGPSPAPTRSRVVVSGRVSAATNGVPIPDVRIQVVGGSTDVSTQSDPAGHYELAGVDPGTVTLLFSASEFNDLQRTENIRESTTLDVQLERKGLTLSGRL